jgi:hypothetical protein
VHWCEPRASFVHIKDADNFAARAKIIGACVVEYALING